MVQLFRVILVSLFAVFIISCAAFKSKPILVKKSELSELVNVLNEKKIDSYAIVELGRERIYVGSSFDYDIEKKCFSTFLTLKGAMSTRSNCGKIYLYPLSNDESYEVEIFWIVNGVRKFLDANKAAIKIIKSNDGNYIHIKWDGKTLEAGQYISSLPFAGTVIAKFSDQ